MAVDSEQLATQPDPASLDALRRNGFFIACVCLGVPVSAAAAVMLARLRRLPRRLYGFCLLAFCVLVLPEVAVSAALTVWPDSGAVIALHHSLTVVATLLFLEAELEFCGLLLPFFLKTSDAIVRRAQIAAAIAGVPFVAISIVGGMAREPVGMLNMVAELWPALIGVADVVHQYLIVVFVLHHVPFATAGLGVKAMLLVAVNVLIGVAMVSIPAFGVVNMALMQLLRAEAVSAAGKIARSTAASGSTAAHGEVTAPTQSDAGAKAATAHEVGVVKSHPTLVSQGSEQAA
ncbi:hypothetical protein HK105_200399 [Polyrhizophydium stewartii]|uniref:Uncharacterized protein n=1 Tax=Polyrhizophydium stewartii TaxID=2732419 RepID=A0ABR4NLB8_9FUNG|nr:hypothetical protein HK105_008150 [Polyrhizophydium stewartii]